MKKIVDCNGKEIQLFDVVKYYERTYVCVDFENDLYFSTYENGTLNVRSGDSAAGVRLLLIKNSPKHKYNGELSICPRADRVEVIGNDGLHFLLTHSDSYLRRIVKEFYDQIKQQEEITNEVPPDK